MPRSLVGVLITALLLVALPFLVALIIAMHSVERLSHSSLQVAVDAEAATQAGRRLWSAVVDMERNALQFLAVQDRAFLEAYRERHVDFMAATRDLKLSAHALEASDVDALADAERALHGLLKGGRVSRANRARIEEGFEDLTRQARALVEANSLGIWRSASALPQRADALNTTLLQLTGIAVVATVGLALLLALMIHRPLRRLDRAIRDLGAGRLETPILIDRGSADLRQLGDRLDWLRRTLREVDLQKTDFLRNVSHELKTPLTAIREGAALLRDGVGRGAREEQASIAGIVLDNSIRLQRLIEDLLQINAGRFLAADARHTTFDWATVVEQVLADHELGRKAKDLELHRELTPTPLSGNAEQLRVVVDNLISNAVRFSPPGTTISVALSRTDAATVLDIKDSGPGITPGDETRIFDLFHRGPAVGDARVKGSGLGLTIARDFVEAHGGRIEVVPGGPGAHFRVSLPHRARTTDG